MSYDTRHISGGEATLNYLNKNPGKNPLAVVAAGYEQEHLTAYLVDRTLERSPAAQIIIASPNNMMVDRNLAALKNHMPNFSGENVLCASIPRLAQFTYPTFASTPPCDLFILDGAHRLPHETGGEVRGLIDRFLKRNPTMALIGISPVGYRLIGGDLCAGPRPIFSQEAFVYSLRNSIKDGHCIEQITTSEAKTTISGPLKKAPRRKADDAGPLWSYNVKAACYELVTQGDGYKAWVVFACGRDHAVAVADDLRTAGIQTATLFGDTRGKARDEIIAQSKAGVIRCIVTCDTLAEGWRLPWIDLVALMRPTHSTAYYLSMTGLAALTYPGKAKAKVLDYAGNIALHGKIDDPHVQCFPLPQGGDGFAPAGRTCKKCSRTSPPGSHQCDFCGHPFPITPVRGAANHGPEASEMPILTDQLEAWGRELTARIELLLAKPDPIIFSPPAPPSTQTPASNAISLPVPYKQSVIRAAPPSVSTSPGDLYGTAGSKFVDIRTLDIDPYAAAAGGECWHDLGAATTLRLICNRGDVFEREELYLRLRGGGNGLGTAKNFFAHMSGVAFPSELGSTDALLELIGTLPEPVWFYLTPGNEKSNGHTFFQIAAAQVADRNGERRTIFFSAEIERRMRLWLTANPSGGSPSSL
jgi:DNA repair protein RadD